MIKGIGIDIIEIDRIAKALDRHENAFIKRIFTRNEQISNHENILNYYAGRFCAKEAVVKALGTGFRGITWQDIEILNDASGKPYVNLSPEISKRFDSPNLLISITHSKTVASAFCLWQG